MDGSNGGLVLGLAQVAIISAIPVLLLWSLIHARDIAAWFIRFGRWLRLLPGPAPVPRDPPIERLAADLNRLAGDLADCTTPMSRVRRRGLQMAYDDVLVTACRALEVPQELAGSVEGFDRDVERLRVESRLRSAGLRIRTPRGREDA